MSLFFAKPSVVVTTLMGGACFAMLGHCGSSSSGGDNPTIDGGDGNKNDASGGKMGRDSAAEPPDGGTGGADGSPDVANTPPRTRCDADAQAGAQGCLGSATCCGGYCVDTTSDPQNCGHCGNACTSHQFCTGVQCDDAIVANVCGNSSATVIFDQYPSDNDGGATIGAALAANCMPATSVVQVEQDAGHVIDPTTGRPLTGVGNTFITGGGQYGQRGIAYLDVNGISPVYPTVTADEYDLTERATSNKILTTSLTALTAHHDYFYVQMAVEPESGTLCFSGIGLGQGPGTVAAGYYLSTELIPNRSMYTATWYLYEWTDANNDATPNAGDTFTQLASGM